MLEIDTHEPLEALPRMQQVVPAKMSPLNDQGWADYKWDGVDGVHHWERKQWSELTSGLDDVEWQLRQEAQRHPEARLGLIVEGVATPGMIGTQLWSRSRKSDVIYKSREQTLRYPMIAAWMYRVGKFIEVMYTADFTSTCALLVAVYQSDQKTDHGTFERYLKPITWKPNPQVEMLAAIGHGVGVGPAKAEAIIKQFGTVWNVLSADPKQLIAAEGVGKALASRLLRKVGRPDV